MTPSTRKAYLVASGDLRLAPNQKCWPTQHAMEQRLCEVFESRNWILERAHPIKESEGHGFIASQREGMEVFSSIDSQTPLVVAEAVWQFSHHVLAGLIHHKGPILTVANWSGQWPGLVGMLNLNGSLTKAGVTYSTLWSERFDDPLFNEGLDTWLSEGIFHHNIDHARPFLEIQISDTTASQAQKMANNLRDRKVILGVFDEGCMGMHNAILPDELLFPLGVFKERLSQSGLFAAMKKVSDDEAQAVYQWILDRGFTFHFGPDETTELTEPQVLEQCRMYIAACRIGDAFGCDAIGIQYQQGLNDLCPASDLAEGLLNNSDRPPVKNAAGSIIRDGQPYTHFNEVDECAGLDGVLTQRVHNALDQPPENTLHDLRWGDYDQSGTTEEYLWVFEISGAAPAAHHQGGYAGSHGYRQVMMYFPAGGSTLSGVAKAGEIIWSRIYVAEGSLNMDIGRGKAVDLPETETKRRLESTSPQWPIMHADLYGVSRDQMMAKHQANHIQVAYANSVEEADNCCFLKAALAYELGINVRFCGARKDGSPF